jgi:hypothetical protein
VVRPGVPSRRRRMCRCSGQAAARGLNLGPIWAYIWARRATTLACSNAVVVLGFQLSRVPRGLEAVVFAAPALGLAGWRKFGRRYLLSSAT